MEAEWAIGTIPVSPLRYIAAGPPFTVRRVRFSHVRVFSDSRNVQKHATKSDTSGHCY